MANPEHNSGRDPIAPLETDSGASQTDWSMIREAITEGHPDASVALETLARRYWPAIYSFIRATGRDVHAASDLTQGFICDVLLARHLLERADPSLGRFRSLLLTALKNYLREQHRKINRKKRAPAEGIVGLDPDVLADVAPAPGDSPEWAFTCQWGATLLRRVLESVRTRCMADQMSHHWEVFEERIARPMLNGGPPTHYAELVRRLGLKDVSQAANMLITVKRRVARELLAEIRVTVEDPEEVQDELQDLLQMLERPT